MTAELIHRLQFAFTITFHYLFPQLTMGLGLLIVILKTVALRRDSDDWDHASHFWGRIFGINFVFGVVAGIVKWMRVITPLLQWAQMIRFYGIDLTGWQSGEFKGSRKALMLPLRPLNGLIPALGKSFGNAWSPFSQNSTAAATPLGLRLNGIA